MFKYLSPTSFIRYRNCPWSVYLEKVKMVLGEEIVKDQTMAQATGTAFDILVKSTLNRRINRDEELSKEIMPKNKAAILLAKEIFECYSKGPLSALREEGIGYGAVDQEIELEYEGKKSILYGKPDLTLTDGTVIDWKCSGMFGRGNTPTNGYVRCFVYGKDHPFNGKDMGSSGKCDTPLEQINQSWAIQTYLYSRLLGQKPGNANLRAGIESICISPEDYVFCASYRNPISVSFQLEIEKEFHSAFQSLRDANEWLQEARKDVQKNPHLDDMTIAQNCGLEPPHPSKHKCISYGKLCPVADYCTGYKNMERRGF